MMEWILTSSAMILIIIALRGLLKGKISLRLQYALWLLVLVRLLLPFSVVESAISVSNWLTAPAVREADAAVEAYQESIDAVWAEFSQSGETLPQQELEQQVQQELYDRTYERIEREYTQSGQTVPSQQIETEAKRQVKTISRTAAVMELLPWIWAGGMAVMAASLAVSNLHFAGKLRRSRKAMDLPGVPLKVYLTNCVATPCLFGLVKPCIYLTEETASDGTMQRHVIAHELSHYRERDHIWSVLRCLCLVLHWYNPLVWWAAVLSKRDAELSCDEQTIRALGEEQRVAYGRTLIGMTCVQRDPKALMLTATTMLGTKKALKERIRLIAQKPKAALYTIVACLVVAAVAVGCTFTGASGETTAPTEITDPTEPSAESTKPTEKPAEETVPVSIWADLSEEELLEKCREGLAAIQSLEYYQIMERQILVGDKGNAELPWDTARYLHAGEDWFYQFTLGGKMTQTMQKDGRQFLFKGTVYEFSGNVYDAWYEKDLSEGSFGQNCYVMDMRWDSDRELSIERAGERAVFRVLSASAKAERIREQIVLKMAALDEGVEPDSVTFVFRFDRDTGAMIGIDRVTEYGKSVFTHEASVQALNAENAQATINECWGRLQVVDESEENTATQPAEPDEGPVEPPMPQLPQLSLSDPLEGEPLTREELDWFQYEFFTYTNTDALGNLTFNIRNMFLRDMFDKPENINLRTLFYDGVSRVTEITQEEKDLYDQITKDESLLDYAKTPREDMERLFYENTGITIAQSKKIGLDQLVYLPPYDAYYVKKGDTAYAYWNMEKGARQEDGTVVILYTPKHERPVRVGKVTLAPKGDSYVFVSNEISGW